MICNEFHGKFLISSSIFMWVSSVPRTFFSQTTNFTKQNDKRDWAVFFRIETLVKQITLMDWNYNYCDMLNMLGDMKY